MLLHKNRKALFDYLVLDKYIAGIKLEGHEVKSIREGKVSFEGAFIFVREGEVILKNLYIGNYSKLGTKLPEDHTTRDRVLLLNKQEINSIKKEVAQKGRSAVPLALILKNNLVKLEFAIVKGKKEYEKKIAAKEKQIKRDLDAQARSYKNE
jgi:SsrA-binding protein